MKSRDFSSPRRAAAFSLVEVLVALTVVGFTTVAFLAYMRFSGLMISTVTNQTVYNQQAGAAASHLLQRIRLCNGFTITDSGSTLTLKYDDDPATDANGDGIKYNDTDHVEIFRITDADGSLTTLADNVLTYQPSSGASARVLARRVCKIGGADFFTADGSRRVEIKFAISGGETTAQSQRVEIATSAYRLN